MTVTTFDDVTARGVPIQVVAAKLEHQWIIRAIAPFWDPQTLRTWIEPFIALQPNTGQIEWTQHTYHVPHYLIYGSVTRWDWPDAGVFLFRIHCDSPSCNTYENATKISG